MKITVRAVQASFDITNEQGESVASYAVENATFATDINGLLQCVSQAAHLFKKLDAEHNVRSQPTGLFERTPAQQTLINAASDFMHACARLDENDEQHAAGNEVYDALRSMRRNASAENTKALADAGDAYMTLVGEASACISTHARKLRAAIAAVA